MLEPTTLCTGKRPLCPIFQLLHWAIGVLGFVSDSYQLLVHLTWLQHNSPGSYKWTDNIYTCKEKMFLQKYTALEIWPTSLVPSTASKVMFNIHMPVSSKGNKCWLFRKCEGVQDILLKIVSFIFSDVSDCGRGKEWSMFWGHMLLPCSVLYYLLNITV